MAVLCSVYSGYMARTFVLTLLIVVAQDGYSCQTPAKIRGLTIEQVRSRLAAGQDDFFLYKQVLDLTPSSPKPAH